MSGRVRLQSRSLQRWGKKINGRLKCTCGEENPYWAGYCSACGTRFGRENRDAAYEKTVWKDLDDLKERIEETKPVKFWKKCLDNFWVKLAIIVICLLPAILIRLENGFEFRLVESEQYSIQYNKQADEHHLFTKQDQIAVDLYCPGEVECIETYLIDEDQAIAEITVSQPGEAIVLYPQETGYVRIVAVYTSGKTERLNVYVFKTD